MPAEKYRTQGEEAYFHGGIAYTLGLAATNNPHDSGNPLHAAWLRGYVDGGNQHRDYGDENLN